MTDWIEWNWTEDKPYPETLKTRVEVKFSTGEYGDPQTVKSWRLSSEVNSFWCSHNKSVYIKRYRVVKP